ncbi:Salicylate hydroxylase [Hypsizygus marmoreus]|uniref:Salicylate hydroxylase n=1 Tax=Hypsizygus marmoreus TaxID=39966 RepID=A0A369K9S4_HYPMA|nr:Salicylate hydroxylase [Hypsizygus marmoreus]
MTSIPKDFKVAIVGGGMCGLLCAVGLARSGIQVDVFESAQKFEEIGAGVGLGPNAVRALDGLGVLEAVLRHADSPTPNQLPFRFLAGVGKHEHVYLASTGKSAPLFSVVTQQHSRLFRPAFLQALEPLIDPSVIHFRKRCVSISDSNSGTHLLHFEGGLVHEADLIIGADGIRSVIRSFVDPEKSSRVVYVNSISYRSLLPPQLLDHAGVKTDLTTHPLCWVGEDKHLITYPVQANKMINIVTCSTNSQVPVGSVTVPLPWSRPASQDEMLEVYSGWGDDATTLLKQIKNPSKWFLHYLHPPLKSYVRRKVVLVGDAAHAMLPHLAAGVGQGFEDVFVLCKLLGHPQTNAANLDVILEAYNNIRVPRANMIIQRSFDMGKIYQGYRDTEDSTPETQRRLMGMWEPVWHHDLAREVASVVKDIYGGQESSL